ncbi:Putative sigma-54 modulation protein [Chlamydiales bacterium SCGC AG-110-P3]|nr:Putative sigma-54 modulation protein [Chlamydiales bacterium SCGC AG-110-P3]
MDRKVKEANAQDYDVTVTGRHVLVTDAMKDYAFDKISKIERFNLRIIDVIVTMDIQKLQHIVNIELKVNDFRLKSTAVSNDIYASIDKAVDKVQAQLRRYKERLNDRQTRGLKVVDMQVNVLRKPADADIQEVNDDIEEETARRLEEKFRPHDIVKSETRPLKILTTEEAVMKMELSGDLFFIYRCEEDQKLKVIYRRSDGDYGLIAPEV